MRRMTVIQRARLYISSFKFWKSGDGLHDVGQEFYFVAFFGDEAAGVHVVGRTIFDQRITAVSGVRSAGGGDGLAESEFNARPSSRRP